MQVSGVADAPRNVHVVAGGHAIHLQAYATVTRASLARHVSGVNICFACFVANSAKGDNFCSINIFYCIISWQWGRATSSNNISYGPPLQSFITTITDTDRLL